MAIQDINSAKVFLGCYVKRLSATLGLNSTPTSVEVELVPGSPTNTIDANGLSSNGVPATGFDFNSALPGRMSGFQYGQFKFAGIIESYTENYGPQGLTYQVRMVDPRIIFKNIYFSLDGLNSIPSGIVGSGVTNYFDILHFYNHPIDADINSNGASYSKIKDFVESTGLSYKLYDKTFRVALGSGFMIAPTGGVNLGYGIPSWYRVPASTISLDELLQKIAGDYLLDYYVSVDFDAWSNSPNSTVVLNVNTINRADATGTGGPGNALDTYITDIRNSGIMMSYKKGKELRSDPNAVMIKGPPLTYWQTPNSTVNEMVRFWGFYDRGFAITTPIDSNIGAVTLDHIIGTKSAVITNQITLNSIYYQKVPTGTIYPPTITRITASINVSGYHPSDLTMRASLYNQESWESILYKEDQSFAEQIGIVRQRFRDKNNLTAFLNSNPIIPPSVNGINLGLTGSGITNRSNSSEALINAVYEATRNVAEQFYGKSWMVKLGDSSWLSRNTFQGTDYIPPLEFEITEAAWSEGANLVNPSQAISYPYNITNHELLHTYNNPTYKDNYGRIKAFASFPDYNSNYTVSFFSYPLDVEKLPRDSIFIEQGNKLVLPIQVDHYPLFPASGIVTLPAPVSALINPTGYDQQNAFYEFLLAMGYNHNDITNWNLMSKADDNNSYGLVPPRIPYIASVEENYGIHIPLLNRLVTYGPFLSSGNRAGGMRIIDDPSISPWNFGSYYAMRQAGELSATIASTPVTIIDYADIQLAGLPDHNLGDFIGESTNITSLSLQIGVDGLTTNYALRTFALPPFKVNKQLSDRLLNVLLDVQKINKEIINLDKVKDNSNNILEINRPSRINLSDNEARNKFNTDSVLFLGGAYQGN